MIYVSLFFSAILLAVANFCASRKRPPFLGYFISGGFVTCLACCTGFAPAVAIQYFLIMLCWLPWLERAGKSKHFLMLSLAATALAYVYPLLLSVAELRKYSRLREKYPFESLEERLPTRHFIFTYPSPLSREADKRLSTLEEEVVSVSREGLRREDYLRRIHEKHVDVFVNTPGFGVGRMMPPNERSLTANVRDNAPIPQPSSPMFPISAFEGSTPISKIRADESLHTLHRESIVDFAYASGFGFVRDRRQVAGFLSHRFSKVPEPKDELKIQRLELIGLLLQDHPVVYLSDNLPNMQELHSAPTRELDALEYRSLQRLRGGEDLAASEAKETVRMLGAVRNAKQCMICHEGSRGDLLGAFSYTMRHVVKP